MSVNCETQKSLRKRKFKKRGAKARGAYISNRVKESSFSNIIFPFITNV